MSALAPKADLDAERVMPRYKGCPSTKAIEKDFPHIVEMRVPLGGFGSKLNAMHQWHEARGIPAIHSTGRRDENNRDYIRWCFADRDMAEAFAAKFAKEGIPLKTPTKVIYASRWSDDLL